jgi:hypothetical protein
MFRLQIRISAALQGLGSETLESRDRSDLLDVSGD